MLLIHEFSTDIFDWWTVLIEAIISSLILSTLLSWRGERSAPRRRLSTMASTLDQCLQSAGPCRLSARQWSHLSPTARPRLISRPLAPRARRKGTESTHEFDPSRPALPRLAWGLVPLAAGSAWPMPCQRWGGWTRDEGPARPTGLKTRRAVTVRPALGRPGCAAATCEAERLVLCGLNLLGPLQLAKRWAGY